MMIDTSEGSLRNEKDVLTGSLVISPRYGFSSGLIVKDADGDRRIFFLTGSDKFSSRFIEARDEFIDFGTPYLRYDPSSYDNSGADVVAGKIIFATPRWGISSTNKFMGQPECVWLDGVIASYFHTGAAAAFSRWQIGLMRGDEFIAIADYA
jgi:hypothetical protein